MGDGTITKKTVLFEGHVVDHVASFERFGKPEVTYWIGKEYWGKGVATKARAISGRLVSESELGSSKSAGARKTIRFNEIQEIGVIGLHM